MKTILLLILVLLGSLAGFVYYLHTPQGRNNALGRDVLSLFGYECPVNRITTKELDDLKLKPSEDIKGIHPSPTKRVWGLTLNQTSEFQLIQWIQRKKLDCSKGLRGYQYIKCVNVPLKKLGFDSDEAVAELDFTLNSKNKLVFIGLLQRHLKEDQALESFKTISNNLNKRLGIPSRSPASVEPEELEQNIKPLSYEYKFKDYVARVTASKLSRAGIVLYEQHLYIPSSP